MARKITRSKHVRLTLMGRKRKGKAGVILATVSVLALSACSREPTNLPPVDTGVFENATACETHYAKLGNSDFAGFCAQAEKDAIAEHESAAPKYASLAECEEEHGRGKCEIGRTASGERSSFLPLMLGYWMGGGFNRTNAFSSQPLYKTRDGRFMSGGRSPVFLGSASGAYKVSSGMWTPPGEATVTSTRTAFETQKTQAAARAKAQTATTANRGGFGKTSSSSRASYGG